VGAFLLLALESGQTGCFFQGFFFGVRHRECPGYSVARQSCTDDLVGSASNSERLWLRRFRLPHPRCAPPASSSHVPSRRVSRGAQHFWEYLPYVTVHREGVFRWCDVFLSRSSVSPAAGGKYITSSICSQNFFTKGVMMACGKRSNCRNSLVFVVRTFQVLIKIDIRDLKYLSRSV
jgi:hypothetical protein